MDRQGLAADWESGIAPAVGGLQDNATARGLQLDYSIESLRAVESVTRTLFDEPEHVLRAEERSLVQALMAYVGVSLIHLTGGRWEWDDEPRFAQRARPPLTDASLAEAVATHNWAWPDIEHAAVGIPIAVPGDGLGLEPVSPLHLLLATVADRPENDSGPLARTYSTWQTRGATPPKPGVVGIDIYDTPAASTGLDAWLAARRQGFGAWGARYPGPWDNKPESIDALTELTHNVTPTVESLYDSANADFVDGATWYLGEMLCHADPARWVDRPHMVRDGEPALVGYHIQTNDEAATTNPFLLLELCLTTGQPKARSVYDKWLKHGKAQS
ncbi:hypothetical protein A5753_02595 [Mycobacterium sp. 852002-51971_SCH5477799-a]|uniref:hypothetical protein n=1 Tax=Mycobacterium sp. 852002-51971_SCH5477799-a TaxID=1834106 RepID=UPI0007FE4620|nr:hypothetical protein [Mycobacterium sp. 852002-51971_SCH5477799-a]OBF68494.1 hypothetical protein A5753_02595 [Mycobacterium sp. 852002-51971_SCH5477799-a]